LFNFHNVKRSNPLSAVLLLVFSCSLSAAADAAAAKAAANLEKQRASIARQARRDGQAGFFTTPWLLSGGPSAPLAPVKADCEPLPETQLGDLITAAATQASISPQLIRAVVRRESGARPCAVSNKGAQGLMQLMPATQQTLGVTDAFDPASNLAGGARYLAELLRRYKGDLRRTLAAYNAGPQRVEPDGDIPDIAETRDYVSAIMAELEPSRTP